jgi:hypothetical protein
MKSLLHTAAGTLQILPPLAPARAPSSQGGGVPPPGLGPALTYMGLKGTKSGLGGAPSADPAYNPRATTSPLYEDDAPSPPCPPGIARPLFDRLAPPQVPCAAPPRHTHGGCPASTASNAQRSVSAERGRMWAAWWWSACVYPAGVGAIRVGGSREGEEVGGVVVLLLSAPRGRERNRSKEFFFWLGSLFTVHATIILST